MPDRVVVFLDYQNVHFVARDQFCNYGTPPERCLVHPVKIAEKLTAHRRFGSDLVGIRVYRGRPNPEHHPTATAANDAQTAAWTRDRRVTVTRRQLNYRGWPDHPPREKGIDVALAVDLVRMAMLGEYDVAIVFTGDTDLLPALETVFHDTTPSVEIAAWSGAKPLWFAEMRRIGRNLPYCHFLNRDDFEAVRDRTDYLGGRSTENSISELEAP